jgi:hypothetical protein
MLVINVPFLPPSVNHYTKGRSGGGRVKTHEARGFECDLPFFIRDQHVVGDSFYVGIRIALGKGQRGDIDNFPKMILDGLADNGVFRSAKGKFLSDAYVDHLQLWLDKESRPEFGRMIISVGAI